MNYEQAYNGITGVKQNNQDLLDSFFLPLVLDLNYKMSFGSEKDRIAGTTLINHQQKVIQANLSNTTQIVFYGNEDPEIKFAADKIYIYLTKENSLAVKIPRFTSMYQEFNIKFDKTDADQEQFEQLISLITYHDKAKPDEKSMRSLQLDIDLSAFQNDKSELLQLVMYIINQALAEDDIGLIKFILDKINKNYKTQYTNTDIMNILKDDYRRRKKTNHQYRLVDVNNLQKEIDLKKQAQSEQANVKPQDRITKTNKPKEEAKPKRISKKDYFKNLFSGNFDSASTDEDTTAKQQDNSSENTNQGNQENDNLKNTNQNENARLADTKQNVSQNNSQNDSDQDNIGQNNFHDNNDENHVQDDSEQNDSDQNNLNQNNQEETNQNENNSDNSNFTKKTKEKEKGEDKHGASFYNQFF